MATKQQGEGLANRGAKRTKAAKAKKEHSRQKDLAVDLVGLSITACRMPTKSTEEAFRMRLARALLLNAKMVINGMAYGDDEIHEMTRDVLSELNGSFGE